MEEQTYTEQIQVALDTTENVASERSDTITLSTGVVLKFRPFPIMRIQAVADLFPYPEVPKVFNEHKQRWESWAGSEEYTKLVEETDRKRGLAVVDTVMAIGTEIVSVPESFQRVLDDDWVDELQYGSQITVRVKSKTARYLAWVKFVAVKNEDDLTKVMSFANKQIGTNEVHVAETLHSNFPDN